MVLQVFEKRKKWFSSYLTNRVQFALIENCSYITKTILRGVLQSSTLGPFLYLISLSLSFCRRYEYPAIYILLSHCSFAKLPFHESNQTKRKTCPIFFGIKILRL